MIDRATPFVIFDTETTGLEPTEGHDIIEIGAEKLVNGKVVDVFDSLLTTERTLDPDVVAIHGITNALIEKEARLSAEVISDFLGFIEGTVLVAHNAGFDIAFLNEHLRRQGVPPIENRVLDTLAIARRELVLPSYSLQSVAIYLKVPQPKAHRALADVQTTRKVFLKLIERAKQRRS
ncbi:MAG: 3'-5' exonuclease [Patescibacteria group bacterium]|jgi:DNA polymerase III epsilon subunit family exonuclease